MSLAWVLLDRGRAGAALREAGRAAHGLTGLPAARLAAQRGLVLQRTGHLDAALVEFRAALPVLERADDRSWQARLRNNRGLLLAYRGELDAAQADLERAAALFASLDQPVLQAWATWNLGFVAARRGDVRGALAHYDDAAVSRPDGLPVPELLLDRAEVLLQAGLAQEARATTDEAVAGLRGLGRGADLAEALVLQAQAALAAGDPAHAQQAAEEAARLLRRQGRPGWCPVARYVALRAAAAQGRPVRPGTAARTAEALEAAGWRVLALDVRLLGARAALAAGRPAAARAHLARAAAARSGPPELRLRAWSATALLRDAEGRSRGTEAALRAGLRALDDVRAGLGATELRVHAAAAGEDLARFGLTRALRDGNADRVLQWSEQVRAAALRLRPAVPPPDGALAAALAAVRTTVGELEPALLEGRPVAGLRAELARRERRVRDLARTQPAPPGSPASVVPPERLRAALGPRCLLALLSVDGLLTALVVGPRRAHLVPLGPAAPAASALDALHFALRRLSGGHGSARALAAALRSARGRAAELDDLLLGPVRARLGDAPLVVVPTAALHAVPWALLPHLRGREVVVSPSASAWAQAAAGGAPDLRGPGLLVAGPRLPGAAAEVAALAGSATPGTTCLTGAQAAVEPVLQALARADWAHLAAHGALRVDNPQFSALELADGPLTVYDLERLPRVPALVVLSACRSGVGAVRAGEEVLGLTGALLVRGARSLVATVLPVPDDATRALVLDLHAGLRAGLAAPAALAAAQVRVPLDEPAGAAAVAGFVALGS